MLATVPLLETRPNVVFRKGKNVNHNLNHKYNGSSKQTRTSFTTLRSDAVHATVTHLEIKPNMSFRRLKRQT